MNRNLIGCHVGRDGRKRENRKRKRVLGQEATDRFSPFKMFQEGIKLQALGAIAGCDMSILGKNGIFGACKRVISPPSW